MELAVKTRPAGEAGRWVVLAGALVAAGAAVVALVILLGSVSRPVVEGIDGVADISVRCHAFGTSGGEGWGGAAGTVCQGPTLRRLLLAGGIAVTGGIVGLVLAADRWQPTATGADTRPRLRRALRTGSSLLLTAGLSAVALGLLLPLSEDSPPAIEIDRDTLLDRLREQGEVLGAFEVVSLAATGGGRYQEELWVVVATDSGDTQDVAAVRQGLDELGWDVGEVTAEFSDGWVAFRGPAGSDAYLVEVGELGDVLAPEADLPANSRRALELAVPGGTDAVAVHVEPSRFAA